MWLKYHFLCRFSKIIFCFLWSEKFPIFTFILNELCAGYRILSSPPVIYLFFEHIVSYLSTSFEKSATRVVIASLRIMWLLRKFTSVLAAFYILSLVFCRVTLMCLRAFSFSFKIIISLFLAFILFRVHGAFGICDLMSLTSLKNSVGISKYCFYLILSFPFVTPTTHVRLFKRTYI